MVEEQERGGGDALRRVVEHLHRACNSRLLPPAGNQAAVPCGWNWSLTVPCDCLRDAPLVWSCRSSLCADLLQHLPVGAWQQERV